MLPELELVPPPDEDDDDDDDDPPAAAPLLALPPEDALLPLDPPLLPPEPELEPAPDEEDDPDAPEPAAPLRSLELAQPEIAASDATTATAAPKEARWDLKRSSCRSAGGPIPAGTTLNAGGKDERSPHSNARRI